MHEFLAFEHIWITDKESFFKNYKKLGPSAADFNQDMVQYVVCFSKYWKLFFKPIAMIVDARKSSKTEHVITQVFRL